MRPRVQKDLTLALGTKQADMSPASLRDIAVPPLEPYV